MQVDVKTQKYIHTLGCRLSHLLCGFALNRVERLSVQDLKTCFNRSRGSRVRVGSLSAYADMHYGLRFSWKTVWKQFLPLVFIPKSKLTDGGCLLHPTGISYRLFNLKFMRNINPKTQEREFLPAINNGVSFANFL